MLKLGGILVFEIGIGQDKLVARLLQEPMDMSTANTLTMVLRRGLQRTIVEIDGKETDTTRGILTNS